MTDVVNHPPHYTQHPSGVECIEITEHFNFNLGNAIKYIWRADDKNDPMTDLRKARFYVDREIQRRVELAEAERAQGPRAHAFDPDTTPIGAAVAGAPT